MSGGSFSETYLQARDRFLDAARAAGASVVEYRNPAAGPSGEPLHVSVARRGRADAPRAILTISGTHGVEGFCGSACQHAWLSEGFGGVGGADQDPEVTIVHVHAINPYGFAAVSRVTEENIDLNRNFRSDWSDLPVNGGYRRLAGALAPDAWSPERRSASSRLLDAFAEAEGRPAWQAAIMGGQYEFPEGLFYGGVGPCWSNKIFRRVAAEHLSGFRELVAIDLHTGLGAHAAMEVMSVDPPGSPGHARTQAWFEGRATSPYRSTSNAQLVQGPLLAALPGMLPGLACTLLAVEFGTSETAAVVEALRADNWARRHARPGDPDWVAVKQRMREHFCPRDTAWQAAILSHAHELVARVRQGLRGAA